MCFYLSPPPGVSVLCPVHSWSTGENVAKDILQHRYEKRCWVRQFRSSLGKSCGGNEDDAPCVVRGVAEGRRGWSVLLKESAQWVELEGSDYVLDLMSDLELPAQFPKRGGYFVISAQEPGRLRANAGM